MVKIILVGIFCFIIGYGAGQFSSSKVIIDDIEKPLVLSSNFSSETKLNLKTKSDGKIADSTESKKITKHKYFKKQNNAIGKAEALLNKTGRMDRRVVDGQPNMDLIDTYEEILSLDPNNTKALSYYSNYMMQLGRYSEAKALVEKCLSVDPDHPSCLGDSTVYAMHGGKREDIDKNIDNCLNRTPSNVRCLHNKAQSFMSKGKAKEALEYFKKLEEANGTYNFIFSKAMIYLGYAQAYEKMNYKVKAKQFYEDACTEGQEYACKRSKEYN